MVNNLPPGLRVDIPATPTTNLVRNDLDIIGLVAEQLDEQRVDDRDHSRREDHDGHVVRLGPVVELGEVRVQRHLRAELADALVERRRDAVEHFTEGVTGG